MACTNEIMEMKSHVGSQHNFVLITQGCKFQEWNRFPRLPGMIILRLQPKIHIKSLNVAFRKTDPFIKSISKLKVEGACTI